RCRSDPQIAAVVTLMMASRGLRIIGSGTVSTRIFSLPSQHTARIVVPLFRRGCSGNFTRFEQSLEATKILANGLRGVATEERRQEGAHLPRRWGVLQMHADLRLPAAANGVEVHGAGGHDIRSAQRSPTQHLVLDFVDDFGIPFDG